MVSFVSPPPADPYAVRPASAALPAAGEVFSLRCVGAQNPASVTWMKSQRPLPAAGRARVTPGNETLTFSPLLQEDDGVYQCVVAGGAGPPIQSVGYIMKVICKYSLPSPLLPPLLSPLLMDA